MHRVGVGDGVSDGVGDLDARCHEVHGRGGADRGVRWAATVGRVRVRPRRGALLVASVIVVATGCSGDDGEGGAGAATTSPTTTMTTTPAPTTTTTTTSTTTTAPTTTTSTTTTVPEPTLEDLEAEVAAAYQAIYDGYWECLRSPLDCDTSWLVEGSPSFEAMQATMQGLADRGRYVGDDPVGYFVIESIEFDESRTEATVVTCWWSTAVLYGAPIDPTQPPGPDNPATVVNNLPSSGFQSQVLVLDRETWRTSSGMLLDDGSDVDVCGGEVQ